MAVNPDEQLHVFATFLGIVPDSDTPPVCGAVLTSAYNGRNRPKCPACERILEEHNRTRNAGTAPAGDRR